MKCIERHHFAGSMKCIKRQHSRTCIPEGSGWSNQVDYFLKYSCWSCWIWKHIVLLTIEHDLFLVYLLSRLYGPRKLFLWWKLKRVRSQPLETWKTHKLFEDHIIRETNNNYVNLPRLLCEKPLLAPNPSNLGIWLQNVISLWSVELYRNLHEINL